MLCVHAFQHARCALSNPLEVIVPPFAAAPHTSTRARTSHNMRAGVVIFSVYPHLGKTSVSVRRDVSSLPYHAVATLSWSPSYLISSLPQVPPLDIHSCGAPMMMDIPDMGYCCCTRKFFMLFFRTRTFAVAPPTFILLPWSVYKHKKK